MPGADVRFGAFEPARLEALGERALQRRTDSQFTLTPAELDAIVPRLPATYTALQVGDGVMATYRTLYFDTTDLRCFHDHRRGRRVRHKIRVRHYDERRVSYLEIKTRRSDSITEKQRVEIQFGSETLGRDELAFIRRHCGIAEPLRPMARTNFRRVTLLARSDRERVTIDTDLVVGVDGCWASVADIVVLEVKQAPFSTRTRVMQALREAGIRSQSMSKYSVALALICRDRRSHIYHRA